MPGVPRLVKEGDHAPTQENTLWYQMKGPGRPFGLLEAEVDLVHLDGHGVHRRLHQSFRIC